MTKEKREALVDCMRELNWAKDQLEYADDQDDEFVVAVHWAINDIVEDIEKALK